MGLPQSEIHVCAHMKSVPTHKTDELLQNPEGWKHNLGKEPAY